jgi:hypothetical protein
VSCSRTRLLSRKAAEKATAYAEMILDDMSKDGARERGLRPARTNARWLRAGE